MPEYKLGPALRFLVMAVIIVIFMAFSSLATLTWIKADQGETTTDRVKLDGVQDERARKETQRLRDEAKEWFKQNRAYDATGKPTPEFLQFLETQSDTARRRGDQRDVIEKTTGMSIWEFLGL